MSVAPIDCVITVKCVDAMNNCSVSSLISYHNVLLLI